MKFGKVFPIKFYIDLKKNGIDKDKFECLKAFLISEFDAFYGSTYYEDSTYVRLVKNAGIWTAYKGNCIEDCCRGHKELTLEDLERIRPGKFKKYF